MIDFTEGQRKTIANGLTVLALTVVLLFVGVLVWGLWRAFAFVSPALVPVILGFILALFFRPYYRWLQKWIRNPTVALVVMLFSVLTPLALILWYAGAVFFEQFFDLVAQAPMLAQKVQVWFQQTLPRLDGLLRRSGIGYENLDKYYAAYGLSALKFGFGAIKCLSGVLSALVTLIFFVFFLMTKERRGGEIVAKMPFLKDDTKAFLAEQIDVFVDILVSFFQRQTIICLIEGVFYGTGFALVGLPYGFLIGFMLGVLNLIPLFGSVVCLPIALPLAYFVHGGTLTRLVLVLVVWLSGQILDGYFITPKIQGNKTGLGYAGVIFSFFFWATVLGPLLGMLLAIPLSAFCVVLWRAVRYRYIRPIV